MNCQEWMNLLPTFLTIVGWFAAFLIAVWQYKKARKQSVSMEVYKQFLDVYTKLAMSISQLKYDGDIINVAMDLTDRIKDGVNQPDRVSFGMSRIENLEQAIKHMRGNLMLLDVWLSVVQISLPNAKKIQSSKNDFIKKFDESWLPLSTEMNIMKLQNKHDTEKFSGHWKLVKATLEEFQELLQEQAAMVESRLLVG